MKLVPIEILKSGNRIEGSHKSSEGQVSIRAKIMVACQEHGRVRRCCINADKVTD